MKLYRHPLSGHCHRVQLFLSLLGVPHELVEVELGGIQRKSEAFLRINPSGQIPVLDDDGVVVPDSNAILVYLAKKLGRTDWLPETPKEAASVQRWLSVAAGDIANGVAAARRIVVFGAKLNADEVITRAHSILKLINLTLTGREWIASEKPTIADIALYSYISSAPEGNVDLSGYPNIRFWLARIESLPGFVAFQKTHVGLAA